MSHVPEFKEKSSEVTWHIQSKYAKEMSMKSDVVSAYTLLDDFIAEENKTLINVADSLLRLRLTQ